MIIPIRCFTCNKLIGDKWETKDKNGYVDLLKKGLTEKEALDKLGLQRFCCRRMLLTHEDNIKKINF
jgi:DNA-directed RNA polymerase I, II, and III subunit RPABC5